MKKYNIEGLEFEVPDYKSIKDDIFEFTEGEFVGGQFRVYDMVMSEDDEGLLNYCLDTTIVIDDSNRDAVNVVIGNFILGLLADRIEHIKQTGNEETDES